MVCNAMEMSKDLLDFDLIVYDFASYRLIEFYHNLGEISRDKCAVLHLSESRIDKIRGGYRLFFGKRMPARFRFLSHRSV